MVTPHHGVSVKLYEKCSRYTWIAVRFYTHRVPVTLIECYRKHVPKFPVYYYKMRRLKMQGFEVRGKTGSLKLIAC